MEPVILNNTYRLERRLTAGGMGAVFVGSHLRIRGRQYAIKKLHAELATNESFKKRFAAEAEAMMELEHAHIVRIEDFLVENEDYYLVMEFVEGEALDATMHREKKLPPHRAAELFRQLLLGLDFCHAKGIIHRDLKPSNLLLTREGNLKITDFGIARQEKVERGLTQTGTILGTPDYMSPEQIVGEKPDQRSDLYACGVILYEMLVGRTPYASAHESDNNYAILYAHLHQEPEPITDPEIPTSLKKLVERCLEKRPQDRIQSAKEALRLLKQGKEDTGLDPSTSDWQKLGLKGRPGLDAIQGKSPGLPSGDSIKDFRLKNEAMTSDFERPSSTGQDSSKVTMQVSEEEKRSLTEISTSQSSGGSFLVPVVLGLLLLVGGAGGFYLFSNNSNSNANKIEPRRQAPTPRRDPVVRRVVKAPPVNPPVRRTDKTDQGNAGQGGSDSTNQGDTGTRTPPPVVVQRRSVPPVRTRVQNPNRVVPPTRHPAYKWPGQVSKMCRFFLKICMKSCVKTRLERGDSQAEDHCLKNCWRARKGSHARKFCK